MKTLPTSAPVIMVWLGLLGTSAAVSMVHAADAIDSHRLFFTPAQRMEASLSWGKHSPDKLVDASAQNLADSDVTDNTKAGASIAADDTGGSVDPVKARHRHVSRVAKEKTEQDHRVTFDGLVAGLRTVQVLVNGLPCESVPVANNRQSDDPVPIRCHGVTGNELTLSLATRAEELLVMESDGRVYRLLPGEGM